MSARHRYVALLASLPHLPDPPFGREPLPLSVIRLERRLGLLDEDHRATLTTLQGLLDWRHLGMAVSDQEVVRRWRAAEPRLTAHGVNDLAATALERRTMIAALRRQVHNRPAPGLQQRWGVGPRLAHMSLHWSDPLLGLGAAFPWLAEARQHLVGDRPRELERLLLTNDWHALARARVSHRFDFRAVVVYVMRWGIVAAWRRYNAEAAERRLDKGIHEGLGHHRNLFPSVSHRE